jgi:hypothetical protein
MQDIKDNENIDKSPLLKPKKTRPPPSEKQKENFQKMAAVRAENIKKRKEEKLLEAQKALLAKNGIKLPARQKDKLKEKEQIQFEIGEQEQESESESEEESPTIISTPKVTARKEAKETKPITKVKQTKMKQVIEESESETDYSSDSSQEVIVIKRGKKKAKAKIQKKERHVEEEEDDQEEYLAEPAINYASYFC